MAFLRGWLGGRQKPDYTGIQIQTSTNTLPVPIVYGQAKVGCNVGWYNNFQIKNTKGKGGILNSSTQNYYAAIILLLCEGPISGIGLIWRDQSIYNLALLEFLLFQGEAAGVQLPWSYVTEAYPSQAEAYQNTAYVANSDYDLGDAATLGNHNFEVIGLLAGTGSNGIDADPALVIQDFLTNPRYGAGFPASSIDLTTLLGSSGDASMQSYCQAAGLCFSPALVSQEQASSILTRWLQLMNCAPVWTGGQLKFIPYGDVAIAAGTILQQSQTRQITDSTAGNSQGAASTAPAASTICTPAQFASDRGVIYSVTGEALTYVGAANPTSKGQYGINPPGTYLFYYKDEGTVVEISYDFEVQTSYNPNLTPLYSLDDDDFIDGGNDDPVKVTVSDFFKTYNLVELDVSARDNAYNQTPIVARDQDAAEKIGASTGGSGVRIAPSIDATEICDENVGAISAQLILQRGLSIRRTFQFKLDWGFCLLDPMDVIEISEPAAGFVDFLVRVTEIEEDEDGLLLFTCEELPVGAASAPLYSVAGGKAPAVNRNAPAPAINPPLIFEPPDALANGLAIWAAVSGQDPENYGGCFVYMSVDGVSFDPVGDTQVGYPFQSRMGVTTAALPAVAAAASGVQTIDAANTLAVDLSESLGSLDSAASSTALQQLATLSIVGSELVAYQNASLESGNAYDLTTLVRGAYGSAIGVWPAGTPFARLDGNVIQVPYNQSLIGTTVYFKFVPFNPFGGGTPSIADVPAYPYTITGAALTGPLPNVTNLNSSFVSGFQEISWTQVTDFRRGVQYEIRQGSSWAAAQKMATQAHPPFVAPGPGTYWVAAVVTPINGVTVYSETPQSIEIAGNMLVENLVTDDDEQAANWPGTLGQGVSLQNSGPDSFLLFTPQ